MYYPPLMLVGVGQFGWVDMTSFSLRVFRRIQFGVFGLIAKIFRSRSVKFGGVEFQMMTTTPNEVHRAVTFATKEPETLEWIDRFALNEEGVFFDIGANVGIYSLYAKARHHSLRIYAFEPEATSFSSLCKNVALNGFKKLIPFQIALSAESGLGELYVSSLQAGAGAAALGAPYSFVNPKNHMPQIVQGVFKSSLAALVRDFGLPYPNYLKIDVDGLEAQILSNAKEILSNPSFVSLLVEFQFEDLSDIEPTVEFLRSCGLYMRRKSDWKARFGTTTSQNFIFSRNG